MIRYLIPLGLFILLVAFLAFGLKLDPREVPSPLIGKPAPVFELPLLAEPSRKFSPAEMKGKVWLLNVWASWCVTCREEHPVLLQFAKSGSVPLYGLDWKDQNADALRWLARYDNPYALTVADTDGRVGIDYGVYGAPETYVIDKQGVIRYKQIGAVTPDALQQKILPLVRELQSQ
jgi:cytochrome c biogenesis protein CcmG, thiol:disulfide interchange protein DsbE